MLHVEHVTKAYGKIKANDDISFAVAPGQIAVLLGPNGAGKSTIIKCIAGLLRFQGRITVGGHDNRSIAAKHMLGYVPEMPAVYDMLTVSEHLEFIARAYRQEDTQADARELLERLALHDVRGKLGRELSKGMQQKVSIACALLPRPELLIFDEPMVGLDPHAIREFKQIVRERRAQGCAILLSTHMLGSVGDDWDVAHIMQRGAFAATKVNRHGEDAGEKTLEELFFAITEGEGPAR